MTDFKVTDEAVEAACAANYYAWSALHQHEREEFRKHMRAAIEAALPVMFGEAGLFVASSRRSDYETHGINPFMYYGTNRDLAEQDAAAIDGEVLTAYVLKESK